MGDIDILISSYGLLSCSFVKQENAQTMLSRVRPDSSQRVEPNVSCGICKLLTIIFSQKNLEIETCFWENVIRDIFCPVTLPNRIVY